MSEGDGHNFLKANQRLNRVSKRRTVTSPNTREQLLLSSIPHPGRLSREKLDRLVANPITNCLEGVKESGPSEAHQALQ